MNSETIGRYVSKYIDDILFKIGSSREMPPVEEWEAISGELRGISKFLSVIREDSPPNCLHAMMSLDNFRFNNIDCDRTRRGMVWKAARETYHDLYGRK